MKINNDKIELLQTWLGAGSINVFGRPFAGKDTVCQKIANVVEGTVLGGGDILRNSHIPPQVQEIMHEGGLVPTEDYIEIVLPYLSKNEFKDKPLILSSVGRWIGEEQGVMQATLASNHPLRVVLYLDISEKAAHQRWETATTSIQRNRNDDKPGVLVKRFDEFNKKTLPVINKYKNMDLLITIDADQPPDAVFNEVITKLIRYATA